MKKVLIIILSVILAISGGLLVYGAIQGTQDDVIIEDNVLSAPALALFDGVQNRYDVVQIVSSSKTKDQKAAEMIIDASYNNILIKQFYFKAHVDVNAADKYSCSDYYRAKNGVNMFYQTLAYTGFINPVSVRIDYVNQRLSKSTTAKYDVANKTWSCALKNPESSNKEVSLPDLTPYNIYSWYDFPLDLGGVKRQDSAKSSEGRSEAIDSSLIKADSVKIEEAKTADGTAYYKLTFNADIEKVKASEETIDRFSDSFGSLSNVEFFELAFNIEIWKDTGVFRQIGFDARVVATISGKRGEANINKNLSFSYDDTDCSVAKHIQNCGDSWVNALNAENKELCLAEIAALPKAEDKATEDAAA